MKDLEIRQQLVDFVRSNTVNFTDGHRELADITDMIKLSGLDEDEFRSKHIHPLKERGLLETGSHNRVGLTKLALDLHHKNKLDSYLRLDTNKGDGSGMSEDFSVYDVAQICLKGHTINSFAQSHPHINKDFCTLCGAKTNTKCTNCGTEILGSNSGEDVDVGNEEYETPRFCHSCGHAYPWTQTAIHAAKEAARSLDLDEQDANELAGYIDDLVDDGPRVMLAASRTRRILDKLGAEGQDLMKKNLTAIIKTGLLKLIFGG